MTAPESLIENLLAFWTDPDQGKAYFEVVESVLEKLDAREGILLDVGCGKGYSSCAYKACGAGRVVGVDVDREVLAQSRQYTRLSPRLQSGVHFLRATASQLPLSDGRVHAVVMNEALSHYAQPTRSLREAYRVLKPGGKLYVFDDNNALDVRGFFRRRFQRWPPYWEEYDHLRREYLLKNQKQGDVSVDDSLVESLRGYTFAELEEASANDVNLGELPARLVPRHPETGAYAERTINPLVLRRELESMGFEADLIPTEFAVTGPVRRRLARLLSWTHPLSLVLSPGFTLLCRKPTGASNNQNDRPDPS